MTTTVTLHVSDNQQTNKNHVFQWEFSKIDDWHFRTTYIFYIHVSLKKLPAHHSSIYFQF